MQDEPLYRNGGRSQAFCLGRRPPSAPQPVSVVQEQPADDHGQVGLETAASLEPPQRVEVPLAEMKPDL